MHPCLRGCLGRQSALTNPVTAQRPSSGRGLSTLQAKRELEAELRRLSDALEESTVRRETLEAQVREQVNETELLRKVRLARARAAWVGRRREQASCQGRMRGTVAAASVRDHWLTLPSTRAVTHLGRRGVCVWGGGAAWNVQRLESEHQIRVQKLDDAKRAAERQIIGMAAGAPGGKRGQGAGSSVRTPTTAWSASRRWPAPHTRLAL